jgi:hypothetical protein
VTAPTVVAGSAVGSAKISWMAAWDRDNQTLSYSIYRDNAADPLITTTAASTFWQQPALSFTDPFLPPGAHTYYLVVRDPDGNQVRVSTALAAGVVSTRSVLPNGQTLDGGAGLVSPNGQYLATVDATGALALVTAAGQPVWTSPAAGPGAHLVMQSDGNLVLYTSGWTPAWNTATWGNTNVELDLRNDGSLALVNSIATVVVNKVGPQLVTAPTVVAGDSPGSAQLSWTAGWDASSPTLSYSIYRDGATDPIYTMSVASTAWQQPSITYTDPLVPAGSHTYDLVVRDPAANQVRVSTAFVAGAVPTRSVLANGAQLDAGPGLTSPNGSYQAMLDATGSLSVTATAGTSVWKSPAAGAGAHLLMQSDGNLVLYSSSWTAVWNTATWGNPNDDLALRDDGTLAVLNPTGPPLWVSQ